MKTQEELELAVIKKSLSGDRPFFDQLRKQIDYLETLKRDVNSAGFFTEFFVPDELKIGDLRGMIDDVGTTTKTQQSICFMLYIEKGKINMLEGYIIPGDWPTNYEDIDDDLQYAFMDERRRYSPLIITESKN